MHVCQKCGYATKYTTNLKRHLARLSSCVKDDPETPHSATGGTTSTAGGTTSTGGGTASKSIVTTSNLCTQCQHVFSSTKEFNRHKCRGVDVRTCPDCLKTFKSSQTKYNHKYYGRCKPQSLVQANDAASTSTQPLTNNTTINNTINGNNTIINNNSQTNNITVNIYGSENIDHILNDKPRMDRYIQQCYMSIPHMVRDVHFDPQRPDNHTVRMRNCRGKFLEIMTDKGWRSKMKNEVFNDMILRHSETLEEHFNSDQCAVLVPWVRRHFEEMLKECTEIPFEKVKMMTLENEVEIVFKDEQSCLRPSSSANPAVSAPSTQQPREIRDQDPVAEMQRLIDKLLKDNLELARDKEELARDKRELAQELDLVYSQT